MTTPDRNILTSNMSFYAIRWRRCLRFVFLIALVLLLPGSLVRAQGCGLPDSGTITTSNTYTLTGNCTPTDTLIFGEASAEASEIDITINGAGHTITGTSNTCSTSSPGKIIIRVYNNVDFNLNNVTIQNGGSPGNGAVELLNSAHSATISDVTFLQTNCIALRFSNENASAITHSLSNLLFDGAKGRYFSADHGEPSAIHTIGPVDLNINNIALRGIFSGNAAIGANDTYIEGGTATKGAITFSGCLTADGVFPRISYGEIVDNSELPCSDTIGNGGSRAAQYAQRAPGTCGLPNGGFVYGRQVFNLRSDCAPTATIFIPYESDVVINGNRYAIDASGVSTDPFVVAGKFKLTNVVVTGGKRFPILTYLDRQMRVSNSIFRANAGPLVFQDVTVTLEDVLIDNHERTASGLTSGIFVNLSAQVSVRDSVFRGNTGGAGVLYAGAPYQYGGNPATTLAGCITFEGNSPADIVDPNSLLTDSRTGPCPEDKIFFVEPRLARAESTSSYSPPAGVCDGKPNALPIGAIACVFREDGRLIIYRVDEESRGHFVMGVTQAQVDANGLGMVAASPDGFAAVYKLEDGNVEVSVGPNAQGMTLKVTLEGGVNGRVLGLSASNGPPPASPADTNAGSRALQSCMVTTLNILNFRDAPAGNVKLILPYHVTLTAFERAADWFYVDYYGARGWIHADYVRTHGNCG